MPISSCSLSAYIFSRATVPVSPLEHPGSNPLPHPPTRHNEGREGQPPVDGYTLPGYGTLIPAGNPD